MQKVKLHSAKLDGQMYILVPTHEDVRAAVWDEEGILIWIIKEEMDVICSGVEE